jgi:hypothetical protein
VQEDSNEKIANPFLGCNIECLTGAGIVAGIGRHKIQQPLQQSPLSDSFYLVNSNCRHSAEPLLRLVGRVHTQQGCGNTRQCSECSA